MMKDEIDRIFAHIKKKGIKLTPQREAVVIAFIKNKKEHMSALDIYDFLKGENKSLGLATIYRTLELLEKKRIVVRRDFDNGTARYEFVINRQKHNHLVCKKCGKVIEIPDLLPDNIEGILLEQEDFYCQTYSVKFYGYCKECYNK
ncbi:MAG TPA: Fur family transcriptional regulator [Halanaerobiales bacterium]|nr:Fur family transcriptional regulator [Halanaerobiales bacterium]